MSERESAHLVAFTFVRWGADVLEVARLTPGDAISIGRVRGARALLAATDLLEVPRVVARATRRTVALEVPAGLSADVTRADAGAPVRVDGPLSVELVLGDRAELYAATAPIAIVIDVSGAPAPAPLGAFERRRGRAWIHFAIAAVLHALLLGMGHYGAEAAEAMDEPRSDLEAIKGWLAKADRRGGTLDPIMSDEGSATFDGRVANGQDGDGREAGGARAAEKAGKLGSTSSTAKKSGRYAVPKRAEVPARVARQETLADARSFGAIGLLAQGPASPTASFGDAEASGRDASAADGGMWGRRAADSAGAGGLGLSGTGIGGGGRGAGIGLGSLGGLGHSSGPAGDGTGGRGTLHGVGQGFSGGWGRLGGSHRTKPPVIRWGYGGSYSGRLPPEAIQRIIRLMFGRFRACYEAGLLRNPALEGRVTVRFVIGRDGAVSSVADAGSTMPDAAVTACVVRAFYGISFPQPEGGIVNVVYPIIFSPG